MNIKHRKILKKIFQSPTPSDIKWGEVESLFINLGAEITQGNGSRVRISLNGIRAVFHQPHPQPTIDKGALVSIRKFLENAGIKYDEI